VKGEGREKRRGREKGKRWKGKGKEKAVKKGRKNDDRKKKMEKKRRKRGQIKELGKKDFKNTWAMGKRGGDIGK